MMAAMFCQISKSTISKQTNGKFIVRVEDTDEARSTRESENMILDDLKWMNMMVSFNYLLLFIL